MTRALVPLAVALCCALAAADAGTAGRGHRTAGCAGRSADVIGTDASDVLRLRGRGQRVVAARGGADRIVGSRGGDVICGGSGRDRILSRGGDDWIDTGLAGDTVKAGGGDDLVLGGGGGDAIYGEDGRDSIYGQLVDDFLVGGAGDDLVSGGHGVDYLFGGPGEDWVRGDTNRDKQWGGADDDTVSYATATPPGPFDGLDGVYVDLAHNRALENVPRALIDDADDDPAEPVREFENVVGSNFDDVILSGSGGAATGLGGSDACLGFAASDCASPATANVSLRAAGPDPGLLVTGGPGDDSQSLTLNSVDGAYVVTGDGPLSSGSGCANTAPEVVSCAKPAGPLGYATVWGGGGPDALLLSRAMPETTTVLLDGGPGDDVINGSGRAEILVAGPSGADRLSGGPSDDALFSGPGPDVLEGGPGSDQLVTDAPCDGHVFSGGPGGGDIAGFAQTYRYPVQATIGGAAIGRDQHPCTATWVQADNEVLEGTDFDDLLIGNGKANALILGNSGDDVLMGKGGADVLWGEQGRDAFYGGSGADTLLAFDHTRDVALFCGPGGHEVSRDRFDPPGASCTDKHRKRG